MKTTVRYTFLVVIMIIAVLTQVSEHELFAHSYFQFFVYIAPYLFITGSVMTVYYGYKARFDRMFWFAFIMILTLSSFKSVVNFFSEAPKKQPGSIVTISTLNVAQLKYTKDDISAVAKDILATNPDIICLQEVGIKENWTNKKGVGKKMADAFKMPYYSFSREDNNIYGLAIFSKLPILESEEIFLPTSRMNGIVLYTIQTKERRKLSLVNYHLSSYNLANYFVHDNLGLDSIYKEQLEEIEMINNLKTKANSYIQVGDMNCPAYGYNYNQLSQKLHDSFYCSSYEYGPSLSNWLLPWRIDGHFYNKGVNCIDFENVGTSTSDHKIQVGHYQIF